MTTENSTAHVRFRSLTNLSNHQLTTELYQLNQKSHRLEAELLLYLGELTQRRLYREEACSSAFGFCVTRMGYSEDVAYKRVGAARLMRQFPYIYDLLVEGKIHLTALMLLKPHLTAENHRDWLLAACNKSKREVEMLVASRRPSPAVEPTVRRLSLVRPAPIEPRLHLSARDSEEVPNEFAKPSEEREAPSQPKNAPAPSSAFGLKATPRSTTATRDSLVAQTVQVAPLSSSTYRVTFTASEQLKQKLDRARELLSHCIPPADLPALIERALDQLLAREQTRRYGGKSLGPNHHRRRQNQQDPDPKRVGNDVSTGDVVAEAQGTMDRVGQGTAHAAGQGAGQGTAHAAGQGAGQGTGHAAGQGTGHAAGQGAGQRAPKSSTRRQPRAAVRREVFERDAGQCSFVDRQGRRCRERHCLEFEHIEAYAIGGTETVANLRLRCREHNALEAERLFGAKRVKAAIAHAQKLATR